MTCGIVYPAALDEWVLAVSRHRDRLHFPYAPHETLEALLDKGRLYPRAQALGIPTPRTVDLSSQDLDEARVAVGDLGFPLVMKPRDKRAFHLAFGASLFVVDDAGQFEERFRQAREFRLLAQEALPQAGERSPG